MLLINFVFRVHDEFSAGLEGILKLRQYNPSFATVQHILRHQKTCDIVVLPPTFVSNLNKRIIKFMLSQKEPVHMEAFIVLKAETNREECLAYLKSVLVNQSQRMAFSTFRELYNNYTDDSQNVIEERET